MAFLRSLVAFIALSCGVLPSPARGAGRYAVHRAASTSVHPARDARHDARRRDRPRGAGCRHARVQRARGSRPALSSGVRDRAGDAASHSSMMTGLYPGRHGVHENARHLADTHPVVAARLKDAGYRTAAFVSSFILARRFGLARGFDVYDDTLPAGQVERASRATTDRALAYLGQASAQPALSLGPLLRSAYALRSRTRPWRRYAKTPYLGEIAAMDAQLGRLVQAFDAHAARQGTRRPSSSPATTARASATTASCSTATFSISRRCTCRWWWWGRALRRR